MTFPIPLVNTSNPLLTFFEYANTYTGDMFGVGFILSFFAVCWLVSRPYGEAGTFVSLILATIVGFFMRIMGLINEFVMILFLGGTIAMAIYIYIKR